MPRNGSATEKAPYIDFEMLPAILHLLCTTIWEMFVLLYGGRSLQQRLFNKAFLHTLDCRLHQIAEQRDPSLNQAPGCEEGLSLKKWGLPSKSKCEGSDAKHTHLRPPGLKLQFPEMGMLPSGL